MRIILASQSPRRKEILSALHIPFDVIVSDIDESSSITDPEELVKDLSKRKGMSVAESLVNKGIKEKTLVISGDTVVALDKIIFGKPYDVKDAENMIRTLSGKTHSVFSGLSLILINEKGEINEITSSECTEVTFREMSDGDISLYLSMENTLDKAGAYAIQGVASLWIDKINGNYFNVVGLPVNKLVTMSKNLGIELSDLTEI